MKRLFFKCSTVFTILTLMGCSVAPVATDTRAAQVQGNEAESIKTAGNEVSMNKPVIIPPGFNDRPSAPGTNNDKSIINSLPALSPAKRLKIDSLFSDDLKDINARFKRLEDAHIEFRKMYEQMKPAIIRLVAIEDDLQILMSELNGFVDEQSAPPPARRTQQMQKPISEVKEILPVPNVSATPITKIKDEVKAEVKSEDNIQAIPELIKKDVSSASVTLKDIRIGNHPDKVRIVFETNSQSEYSLDLSNDDQVMIITFLNTVRDGGLDKESVFARNPLLSSYMIKQQGSDTKVIIILKRATTVQFEEVLAAQTEQKNDRIVIDLAI